MVLRRYAVVMQNYSKAITSPRQSIYIDIDISTAYIEKCKYLSLQNFKLPLNKKLA